MRSRYSAYVLGLADYLLQTWHADTRPRGDDLIDTGARWLGLEVRHAKSTGADTATVEFVARCRGRDGRATRLHERSRFVRADGRWTYLDGEMAPFSDAPGATRTTPTRRPGATPDENPPR